MIEPRVTILSGPAPGAAPLEMAERKGRGHPDSICDALAENLSIGLARFYLERFGAILHHNVDKALLLGGAALANDTSFGVGFAPLDRLERAVLADLAEYFAKKERVRALAATAAEGDV